MTFLAVKIEQSRIITLTLITRLTQRCNETRLDNSNQSVSDRDIDKWVINLSKTELTTAQKAVLAKGPTYAISPSNIPNLEHVTAIESIGHKLKEGDASELKADINTILRKGQTPQTKFKQGRKKGFITSQQRSG